MGSCVRYRKRIGAYLDGELNVRRNKAVAAHVAKCKACRAVLEDLRLLIPVMHALEVPPVPAGFTDHVMALARTRAVRPQKSVTGGLLEWWQIISAPLRFTACATVLLAIFLGLTMGREVFLSGYRQAASAGVASVEGFEWFSQTPPASLAATYLTLASNNEGGITR